MRKRLETRLGKIVAGIISLSALVAAVISLLNDLSGPSRHTIEANFRKIDVETPIYLRQYENERGLPTQQGAANLGPDTQASGYRLVADRTDIGQPASSPPAAATATPEEPPKTEGEKISNEVKRTEQAQLEEEAKIKEEQKNAEARVQREQQKAQEDAKLAERSTQQNVAVVKAEEAEAKHKATRAREAVQTKKAEARHTPTKSRIEAGASSSEVESVLSKSGLSIPVHCDTSCGVSPLVNQAIDSSSSSSQAANRFAADLRGSLVSVDHEPQFIGARVEYSITLDGLANKVTFLTVTLDAQGQPLPSHYQETRVIKKLVPSNERQPVVGVFWAPIPSYRGEYYFRLQVFDGSPEPVGFEKTQSFR
jgi:outer membrane biosynthesis protein TonB